MHSVSGLGDGRISPGQWDQPECVRFASCPTTQVTNRDHEASFNGNPESIGCQYFAVNYFVATHTDYTDCFNLPLERKSFVPAEISDIRHRLLVPSKTRGEYGRREREP